MTDAITKTANLHSTVISLVAAKKDHYPALNTLVEHLFSFFPEPEKASKEDRESLYQKVQSMLTNLDDPNAIIGVRGGQPALSGSLEERLRALPDQRLIPIYVVRHLLVIDFVSVKNREALPNFIRFTDLYSDLVL